MNKVEKICEIWNKYDDIAFEATEKYGVIKDIENYIAYERYIHAIMLTRIADEIEKINPRTVVSAIAQGNIKNGEVVYFSEQNKVEK